MRLQFAVEDWREELASPGRCSRPNLSSFSSDGNRTGNPTPVIPFLIGVDRIIHKMCIVLEDAPKKLISILTLFGDVLKCTN
jgi:hypothetical protein